MVEKIIKSLSLTVPTHVLRSRDPRALLLTVFASWLPLSTALLVSVIEHIPSPPAAQSSRLPALIDKSPGSRYVSPHVRNAMINFETLQDVPIVAYVSKVVAIPASELPQNKRKGGAMLSAEEARDLARKKRAEIAKVQAVAEGEKSNGVNGITEALGSSNLSDENKEEGASFVEEAEPEYLIGFARLYSGTLSVGDSVYVLPPKFSPANPHAAPEPQRVTVTALYLLMGRGLESLASVPAGVVFGIGGLEGHIFKSGTLCSQLEGGINLAGVSMGTQPIVRVALEPTNPTDLEKMITGIKLLVQSDPCAQYEVLESGEHVILTAGELHLERCLKDLRERYARCEIQEGEPIVPYRESIVSTAEMAPPKDKVLSRGTVIGVIASKQVSIRLRVKPLPVSVTEFLEKNAGAVRRLYAERKVEDSRLERKQGDEAGVEVEDDNREIPTEPGLLSLEGFKKALKAAFAENENQFDIWTSVVDNISAFGPRRTGPNILIDSTQSGICQKL